MRCWSGAIRRPPAIRRWTSPTVAAWSFFTGWGSLTAYGSWRSPPTTRFTYPSVDESDAQTRARHDGTLPLEPSRRVSQILLEPRPRLGSLLAGLKGFQATAP